MRIVVLSDIHANFDALEGILTDLAGQTVDQFVCLGDVVGYYAQPQECVDRVREMEMLCIQGNHDGVAGGGEEPHDFNSVAADAIFWTRAQLDADSRKWLGELSTQAPVSPDIWAVHGSLRDRDEYVLDMGKVRENFALMTEMGKPRVVFFGHTHRRAVYRCEQDGYIAMRSPGDELVLASDSLFLINPGGAGQPRDGVPGAPYAIIEDDVVRFRRARYNVDKAARRVEALPFGEMLGRRLRRGV